MDQHFDIGKKCHGVYLGTVVQHLTHGQLKVYIQGIYPQEWATSPALLPICQQVTPQFGGSHDGNGIFSYPNIGSTVVCVFANGDQNYPLTIGSILGGMNAFGQYEHIKSNNELSSSKHLVTAGKAHLEMYESGKISAVVVDPIRTQAEVAYGSEVDAPLSIDAVTSRPICEQVEAKELSSIECQYVMDNFYGHGTISSSTHWFDPLSYSSTTSSDDGQKTSTEKKSGTVEVDSYAIVDNDGHREFGHTRKDKVKTSYAVIDGQSSTNQTMPLTSDVKTSFKHNLDGTSYFSTTSAITDALSYSNSGASGSEMRTRNLKVDARSACGYSIDTSFCISGEVNQKLVEAYSKNGDTKSQNLKSKYSNSIAANKDNSIAYTALSSSRLTEIDPTIGLDIHSNRHSASAKIEQSSQSGFNIDADWNDDDMQVLNGTTIQEKHTNFSYVDSHSGKNPSILLKSQKKLHKMINSSSQDYNVVCEHSLSPTDGSIVVKITDNMTKMGCTFKMDSNGNMSISASSSISIDAPTVSITGQSMAQSFKTYAVTAQTLTMQGGSGDCKIKNVSLLNHKHQETQSGDVVHPQPTKTAAQSN